jgi:hypothetical protein
MNTRTCGCVLITIFTLIPLMPSSSFAGETSLNLGPVRIHRPIKSFQEIRQTKTIRQRWDRSCGSAALSTILTHHYSDSISEAVIIMSILHVTDPAKIRARGGFSLLDLKRFVESKGYEGKGYAGLTLDELSGFHVPAIVPVKMKGYNHFVVFRSVRGDRIVLSDPSFGTLTMKVPQFLKIWKEGIGFIVLRQGLAPPSDGLNAKEEELLILNGTALTRFSTISSTMSTRVR